MRKLFLIAAVVVSVSCNESSNSANSVDSTGATDGTNNAGTTDTINRFQETQNDKLKDTTSADTSRQ